MRNLIPRLLRLYDGPVTCVGAGFAWPQCHSCENNNNNSNYGIQARLVSFTECIVGCTICRASEASTISRTRPINRLIQVLITIKPFWQGSIKAVSPITATHVTTMAGSLTIRGRYGMSYSDLTDISSNTQDNVRYVQHIAVELFELQMRSTGEKRGWTAVLGPRFRSTRKQKAIKEERE